MSAAKKLEDIIAELERALTYYKRKTDELSGENIKGEYRISGLRKEIKQKRSAFALISKLQLAFGKTTSVDEIFKMTLEAISQTLDVDRVFILTPSNQENCFAPQVWQGLERLTEEKIAGFKTLSFEFPKEFYLDSSQHLLFSRETPPTDLSRRISTDLDLPFFACAPIVAEERPLGIIMMGRLKEVGTAYPPLDMGDVETLFSIAGLVSSIVQNMRVGVLQEMDRLKSEFFANLSHEFRTPITLTLGAIEGIMGGRYGEVSNQQILDQADLIKRNQSRLLNLINQILDLEKLESGKITLKVQRIEKINLFLQKRLEQFSNMTAKKSVELIYVPEAKLEQAQIFVDPEKFDRMIFNLLSNAVKFTPKGHIKLEAFITDTHYGFRVTDSGIGIKASQLPHIFDRFRQADGSTSREYAGTGIGLSLVKQIAEQHGGAVEVRSQYGSGTTFEIKVPLGSAHFSQNDVIEEVYVDSERENKPTQTFEVNEGKVSEEERLQIEQWNESNVTRNGLGKVLYVDDNKDLRHYVRDLLKDEFNVYLGYDGKDGLEKAIKYKPDVIVSDLMMPIMTGEQFLIALKESSELKQIPFVLLTAKSGIESKVSNLALGADDYLNKPFSELELRVRVKNLIMIRKQQLRIHADLIAARGIQRALLPNLGESNALKSTGVHFDVFYRPCEILSGDFYDVIDKGDIVYFYVADVTSHGTASAQVTYLIKSIVHEIIENSSTPISVSDLMKSLHLKFAALRLGYGVGIQLGAYSVRESRLSLVTSNSPPCILKSKAKISFVSPKPGPYMYSPSENEVGDSAEIEYQEQVVSMNPGDHLFAITDGCYEFKVKQTDRNWSIRGLSKIILESPHEAWQEFIKNEITKIHGDANFSDDITILRISRL